MLTHDKQTIIDKKLVDADHLTAQLREVRIKSFDFQNKQQKDSVILERFDFTMGPETFKKKVLDKTKIPVRMTYQFDIEFGFVSPVRKVELMRSGMMGVPLTMYEISKNPHIFDKNFMFFINGLLVDCVKIIVGDGTVTVSIGTYSLSDRQGVKEDELNEWINNDAQATIVMFSNGDLNPYVVDHQVLKTQRSSLALQTSGIVEALDTEQKYLTFVTSNGIGYSSKLTYTPDKDTLLNMFKEMDKDKDVKRAFINIFGFRNLAQEIKLSETTRVFQIPGFNMPIPPENIMVFEETSSGRRLSHGATIEFFYPNFYEVKGVPANKLSLLVFYSDFNVDAYHTNELASYYKIMGDNVQSFLNAPEEIRNYKPYVADFTIKAYDESSYEDTLDFKLGLMSEIADGGHQVFIDYLKSLPRNYVNNVVDMSKIDLKTRLRLDNKREISNVFEQVEFDDAMYMTSFRDLTDGGKYRVSFYIDGQRFEPQHLYTRGKYDFLYIPIELVSKDSIIDIEKTKVFDSTFEMEFDDTLDYATFENKHQITRQNIFIVDENNTIVNPTHYELAIKTEDGGREFFHAHETQYIPTGEVMIRMLDDKYTGQVLTLHTARTYFKETGVMEKDELVFSKSIDFSSDFREENLRVFRNGRLIQRPYFDTYLPERYLDPMTITVSGPISQGETVVFEYLPDSYNKVLDLSVVPEDGVIYLKDIISKPYTSNWIDIYVNGRKLSRDYIDVLSPYLIQLKNLESMKNLVIFEKTSDYTVFLPSDVSNTLISKIWENDEDFRNNVITRVLDNDDFEESVVAESWMPYLLYVVDAFDNELRGEFTHINPDVEIPIHIMRKYPSIFPDGILHINGDNIYGDDDNINKILHINPDIVD